MKEEREGKEGKGRGEKEELDISRNEPKWKKKGKGKRKEENVLVSAGRRCAVTELVVISSTETGRNNYESLYFIL